MLDRVRAGRLPAARGRSIASIDPALEAVCLKAMALRPEDRYDSPRSLAEDIERWLADEPVTAYREPLGRRLRRWGRRHRTAVTGVAAAVTVTLVSLTLGVIMLSAAREREHAAHMLADRRKIDAEQQRDLAVRNFRLAREAVDRYLTRVSEDGRLKTEALESLRKDLLESAREFYDRFLEQQQDDPELRAERGRAYARLALITDTLGSKAEAIALIDRSREIFEALLRARPGDRDNRYELADGHTLAASLLHETGRDAEADASCRAALRCSSP